MNETTKIVENWILYDPSNIKFVMQFDKDERAAWIESMIMSHLGLDSGDSNNLRYELLRLVVKSIDYQALSDTLDQ